MTPIANQASMTNARALVADIYGPSRPRGATTRHTRWMRRADPQGCRRKPVL
jgi:hypothetical protein